jgi:hypothetical protein
MPTFIIRDIGGKPINVVEAENAQYALDDAQVVNGAAFRADPDNPARIRLSALLTRSGLSAREFARRVLGRDVRSLSRYLGGEIIPPELADQILRMDIETTASAVHIMVARIPGDSEHVVILPPSLVFVTLLSAARTRLETARHLSAMQKHLRAARPEVRWVVDYKEVPSSELPEISLASIAAFAEEPLSSGGASRIVKLTDEATLDWLSDVIGSALDEVTVEEATSP